MFSVPFSLCVLVGLNFRARDTKRCLGEREGGGRFGEPLGRLGASRRRSPNDYMKRRQKKVGQRSRGLGSVAAKPASMECPLDPCARLVQMWAKEKRLKRENVNAVFAATDPCPLRKRKKIKKEKRRKRRRQVVENAQEVSHVDTSNAAVAVCLHTRCRRFLSSFFLGTGQGTLPFAVWVCGKGANSDRAPKRGRIAAVGRICARYVTRVIVAPVCFPYVQRAITTRHTLAEHKRLWAGSLLRKRSGCDPLGTPCLCSPFFFLSFVTHTRVCRLTIAPPTQCARDKRNKKKGGASLSRHTTSWTVISHLRRRGRRGRAAVPRPFSRAGPRDDPTTPSPTLWAMRRQCAEPATIRAAMKHPACVRVEYAAYFDDDGNTRHTRLEAAVPPPPPPPPHDTKTRATHHRLCWIGSRFRRATSA